MTSSFTPSASVFPTGGYECYIISDTSEGDATLAAEVYTADGEDAEESLLSVSPMSNVLSLVMRDGGIMR